MKQKKIQELYKEFRRILQEGDEKKAKDFLIDNLKSFSKETQNKIILAFFLEELASPSGNINSLETLKQEMLEEAADIEKARSKLEDKLKAIQIKEKIDQKFS